MNLSSETSVGPRSRQYEIGECIGRGASGEVYKALDLDKRLVVALKCLRFPHDATARYHLKQEFRALSDIYHPNLAQLYELEIIGDNCFIAMELVEGSDFVSFARRSHNHGSHLGVEVDFTSVRTALAQLVKGLTALHGAGKLHQDIKPTNVLVEPAGRAVLVDFGLAVDLNPPSFDRESQSRLHAGTPAYMSPERLRGSSPSEASDWYSVGVMLYEALVGARPFAGETPVAVYQAQQKLPAAPHLLDPKVPHDLSEFSLALLRRDPNARAGRADVCKLTSSAMTSDAPGTHTAPLGYRKDIFVGRAKEEEELRRAFQQSLQKHATVIIEGVSGVGKTTLIEHFVSSAYDSDKALVLRSRCHHQERVRYNAVDGLIDSLSRFLVLQTPSYLADAAPKYLNALLKVFPDLARVNFPKNHGLPQLATDPQLVLRHASEALRELLTNITEKRPLIVWVDDAQWCDSVSTSLLRDVFTHQKAPKNLLIISFRSEDREESNVIPLLSGADPDGMPAPLQHISVSPLNEKEIKTLISNIGGVPLGAQDEFLQQTSKQTKGLPLFVVELARHYRAAGPQHKTAKAPTDFVSLLKSRLQSLPEVARSLLEIVAVSIGPLEEDVLLEVAGADGRGAAGVYRLCRDQLLRKSMVHKQWALESFHDQIRDTVLKFIDEIRGTGARQQIHLRIAEALRTRKSADPEILVEHYVRGEDQVRAAKYALIGGKKELKRLAFDRAADLFGWALDLRQKLEDGRLPNRRLPNRRLLKQHAQALANAGRTEEAAKAYLKAVKAADQMGCGPDEISDLKAKAAEQFLTGGRLSEGERYLGEVFADLQIPFPGGPKWRREMRHVAEIQAKLTSLSNRLGFLWKPRRIRPQALTNTPPEASVQLEMRRIAEIQAKLTSLWNRLRFHWKLRRIRPQALTNTPPEASLRLDTLWVASRDMLMLDYVIGDAMASWYLTEIARQPDRSRLVGALALEATLYANVGGRWRGQSTRLIQRANELLQDSRNPYDHAFMKLCRSLIAWCDGNWQECCDIGWGAVDQFRRECTGVNWEVSVTLTFALAARLFLGDLRGLEHQVAELLDDAKRRRDHYVSTVFRSGYLVFLALARDEPQYGLECAKAALEDVPCDRFSALHLHHFNAATNAQLYMAAKRDGRASETWSLIEERWPLIQRAGLLHLDCIGSFLREVRGRAAVAAAREKPPGTNSRSRLLRVALKEADFLAAGSLPHVRPMAAGIHAGVAAIKRDAESEKAALQAARSGFEGARMRIHHAAAGIRLGTILSGEDGRALATTSTRFLASQGIKDPKAMTTLLFPGAA